MTDGIEQEDSAPEADGRQRLRYRLLTGPDDRSFCERISAALADGYVLHGSPMMAARNGELVVGQAVVLPVDDIGQPAI